MKNINLSELEKLKIVETDILDEIYRVCDKNNIKCYLYGGTLLGAVRHEGFIPWDDDIDVCMFREDYEKFAKIAPRELKDGYFYQNYVTDPEFPYNFAKVRMDNTVMDETGLSHLNIHKGIWVDILPVDKQSKKAENSSTPPRRDLKRSLKLQAAQELLYVDPGKKRNIFKTLMLRIYRALVSRKYMHKKLDKFLTKHNNTKSNVYGNRLQKFVETFSKNDYGEGIDLKFEGRLFKAPANYENILSGMYGDYMKLPPEEERYPHHDSYKIDFGDYFD